MNTHFKISFVLAGLLTMVLAMSLPEPYAHERERALVRRSNGTLEGPVLETDNEIHENILSNWDPARVITSADLESYINSQSSLPEHESDYFIYLSDERAFISLPELIIAKRTANTSLTARQDQSGSFYQRRTDATHYFWYPWLDVSECLSSNLGSGGGSLSFGVTESYEVGVGGGLDLGPFKSIFTASFNVEVTWGYSTTYTYSCNVPAKSVGQVWQQRRMAWAAGSERFCTWVGGISAAHCGGWNPKGWARTPVKGNGVTNFGCSTGSNNVRCGGDRTPQQ